MKSREIVPERPAHKTHTNTDTKQQEHLNDQPKNIINTASSTHNHSPPHHPVSHLRIEPHISTSRELLDVPQPPHIAPINRHQQCGTRRTSDTFAAASVHQTDKPSRTRVQIRALNVIFANALIFVVPHTVYSRLENEYTIRHGHTISVLLSVDTTTLIVFDSRHFRQPSKVRAERGLSSSRPSNSARSQKYKYSRGTSGSLLRLVW